MLQRPGNPQVGKKRPKYSPQDVVKEEKKSTMISDAPPALRRTEKKENPSDDFGFLSRPTILYEAMRENELFIIPSFDQICKDAKMRQRKEAQEKKIA